MKLFSCTLSPFWHSGICSFEGYNGNMDQDKAYSIDNAIEALNSSTSELHMEALQWLGKQTLNKDVLNLYIRSLDHKLWKIRKIAAARLSSEIGISFHHLLPLIQSPSQHVRYWTLQILPKAGKKAVSHLIEAFPKLDSQERLFLLRGLQELNHESVIPFALERLNDDLWANRKEASKVLLNLKQKAIPALKEAIRNGSDNQRFWCFKVLGKMSRESALETFVTILESEAYEEKIRSYALTGIQEIDSHKIIPVLVRTLDSDCWTLRAQAAKILISLDLEPHQELIEKMLGGSRNLRYWGHQILKSITKEKHLGLLENFLRSKDFDLHFQAISILGQVKVQASVNILLAQLNDPTWYIRKHASDAVLAIGKCSLQPLIQLVNRNPEDEVLFWICRIMGDLNHTGALPTLERLLTHQSKDVRLWALEAVAKVGGLRSVKILIESFANEFWIVRSKAHEALLEMTPPSLPYLPLFESLNSEDESKAYWSQKTIEESNFYGAKSLMKILVESKERERLELLERLSLLTENSLEKLLQRDDLRKREIMELFEDNTNLKSSFRRVASSNNQKSDFEFSVLNRSEYPYETQIKFDEIMRDFAESGAQTLHLKVDQNPVARMNGSLYKLDSRSISATEIQEFLSQSIPEEALTQFHSSGVANWNLSYKDKLSFRVHCHRTKTGIEAILKIQSLRVPDFESLQLPSAFFSHLAKLPRGLILFSGSSGSGKSTAINSLLSHINQNYSKNILMVTDKVEFEMEENKSFFTQKEVGSEVNSFEEAVEAMVYEDPDIVYLSRIPDYPQLELLLHQASSQSLVILETNAPSNRDALEKILLLFPKQQQRVYSKLLQSALQACCHIKLLHKSEESGFIPALEHFLNHSRISKCLDLENLQDLSQVLSTSKQEFLKSMDDYLLELASSGRISYQEAIRFMEDKSKISVDQIW